MSPPDPLLGCLEELSRRFQRPRSRAALVAGLPVGDNPLTPELFVRAATRNDLQAELIEGSLDTLQWHGLPAVFLGRNGALLLLGKTSHGYEVWRPESGAIESISLESLLPEHSGRFIRVQPAVRLDERASHLPPPEQASSWFWKTLWRYRTLYLDTILTAFVVNLFTVVSSLFAMNVYDRVVPNRAYETLWVLTFGVLIVFVFEFALRTLRSHFIDVAGKRADLVMSSLLFERVMGLRLEHRPASAGSMANLFKEFESLRDFFTSATMVSIVDLPFLFIFIAIIWVIGGPLFWIPLLAAPLIVGIGFIFQPSLSQAMRLNMAEATQKHGLLVEALAGIETLKTLSAEGQTQSRWEYLVAAASESAKRSRMLSTVLVNLTNLVQQFVYVVVVIGGVYLIGDNLLTMGALIACSILSGRAMAPLAQISALFVRYQAARHALTSLNRLVALDQERPAEQRFLHRESIEGSLQVEEVSFAYPGQQVPALQQIALEIRPGEHVAIVGKIGSGKSTLLKLLVGLYRPNQGTIRIDGVDIAQIDPADLRRHIAYVEQDTRLFFGTLRENIALGTSGATDDQIVRAARMAGLEELVQRHPMGFEMRIGEGGAGLSGGQRQAVAVARALLREPDILLLDEPTAGMDQGSEQTLIRSLGEYAQKRTLVVVTHKPTMLPLVDKLVVIDAGKVVACGPKAEVLAALGKNEEARRNG